MDKIERGFGRGRIQDFEGGPSGRGVRRRHRDGPFLLDKIQHATRSANRSAAQVAEWLAQVANRSARWI